MADPTTETTSTTTVQPMDEKALAVELAALDKKTTPAPPDDKAQETKAAAPKEPEAAVVQDDKGPPDPPSVAASIAKVAKMEKAARDRLAVERTKFEQVQAADAAERAAWKQSQQTARQNLPAHLRALGIEPKEFEAYARQLYDVSQGKAGELPAQTRVEQEIQTLKQQQEQNARQFQEWQQQQAITAYRGQLQQALPKVPAEHTWLTRAAAAMPEVAVDALLEVASQHAQKYGTAPSIDDLYEEAEASLSSRLSRLAPLFASPTKTSPGSAVETTSARTVSNATHTTHTKPRSAAQSEEEEEKELIRELTERERTRRSST